MNFNIGDKVKFKNGNGDILTIKAFDETTSKDYLFIDIYFDEVDERGYVEVTPDYTISNIIKIEE